LEAAKFFQVTDAGSFERPSQYGQGLVVGLRRNGKWASVLTAVRERKTRWICESARRTVN